MHFQAILEFYIDVLISYWKFGELIRHLGMNFPIPGCIFVMSINKVFDCICLVFINSVM